MPKDKGSMGDNQMDPFRGREKAEKGGAPDPGYAKVSKPTYDEDANYTRPMSGPNNRTWLNEDESAAEEAQEED